jgi:hypothetical protein
MPYPSPDHDFLAEPEKIPPLRVRVMSPSTFASAFQTASKVSEVPKLQDLFFVFTLSSPKFPGWPAGEDRSANRAVAFALVKDIFPADTDVRVELSTDIRSPGVCLRFKSNSNTLILQGIIRRPDRFHFKSHVSYLITQLATFDLLTERTNLLEPGFVGVTTTNLDTEPTYMGSPAPAFHPKDLYPEHLAAFVTKLSILCNQLNPDIPGDSRAIREDAGVRVSILVKVASLDNAMLHSPLPHAMQWLAAYPSRWWRCVGLFGLDIYFRSFDLFQALCLDASQDVYYCCGDALPGGRPWTSQPQHSSAQHHHFSSH